MYKFIMETYVATFLVLISLVLIVVTYFHHVISLNVMKCVVELQKLQKKNNIDEDKTKAYDRCLFINQMIYNPLYCYCVLSIDQECLKLASSTYCEMREFFDLENLPPLDEYLEEKTELI